MALKELVDAKINHLPVPQDVEQPGRGNVVNLMDVMAIEQWLNDYQTLPTPDRTVKGLLIKGRPPRPASKKTKTLMKGFIHRVFELAIKWGYLTMQRNPIGLVEIKGKSKRSRPLWSLSLGSSGAT